MGNKPRKSNGKTDIREGEALRSLRLCFEALMAIFVGEG